MASMRDIKRRKESVQSTQQITKAMKLVSTVKLQKARGRAESNKPYFNMLYQTICSILAMTKVTDHKFLKENVLFQLKWVSIKVSMNYYGQMDFQYVLMNVRKKNLQKY